MLYVHRREITVILSSAASTSFPHLISFYFPTFARLAKRQVIITRAAGKIFNNLI